MDRGSQGTAEVRSGSEFCDTSTCTEAVCEAMNVKPETLVLSWEGVDSSPQVVGELLHQTEDSEYVRV